MAWPLVLNPSCICSVCWTNSSLRCCFCCQCLTAEGWQHDTMRGLTVFWHHAGQRACKSILVTLTCGFLLRQPAIIGQSKASNLLKQWSRPSSLPLPPLVFTCWRSLRHNRTTLDRSLLESNPFSAFIHLQWPQQNVKSTSNAVFPPQRTSGFQAVSLQCSFPGLFLRLPASGPLLTRLCPPVPSHAVGFPPLRPQVDKQAASILSIITASCHLHPAAQVEPGRGGLCGHCYILQELQAEVLADACGSCATVCKWSAQLYEQKEMCWVT